MSSYDKIWEYVSGLEIIDTHEHLISSESTWLEKPWRDVLASGTLDIFKDYLLAYVPSDLVSAGMSASDLNTLRCSNLTIMEKWNIVEPYWEFARYTGYLRAIDISVQALYGLPGIFRDTVEEANRAFLESLKPGRYKKVLKDHSKIKLSILDSIPIFENISSVDNIDLAVDTDYFRSVFMTVPLVIPETMLDIQDIEEKTGIRVTSFDAWLNCCKEMIDRAIEKGAVALKTDIAYKRSLLFERTNRSLAETEFIEFLNALPRDNMFDRIPVMGINAQNYIMHYIFELANERELVYQIHTGLLEGSGNYLAGSDPVLLNNVFLQYPDIRFDIFHIGYPFQHKITALAKNHPNVFIDMCWAHIISPHACVSVLTEWFETVPYNKILGFGGDQLTLDAVYGHQIIARENISKALAIKVDQGLFDRDKAKDIAEHILYHNPKNLFRLEI